MKRSSILFPIFVLYLAFVCNGDAGEIGPPSQASLKESKCLTLLTPLLLKTDSTEVQTKLAQFMEEASHDGFEVTPRAEEGYEYALMNILSAIPVGAPVRILFKKEDEIIWKQFSSRSRIPSMDDFFYGSETDRQFTFYSGSELASLSAGEIIAIAIKPAQKLQHMF